MSTEQSMGYLPRPPSFIGYDVPENLQMKTFLSQLKSWKKKKKAEMWGCWLEAWTGKTQEHSPVKLVFPTLLNAHIKLATELSQRVVQKLVIRW